MNVSVGLTADMIAMAYALCVSVAAFGIFADKGHAVAEAGVYGLMLMLMVQSWTAQVLDLSGLHQWLMMLQAAAVLSSLVLITAYRRRILSSALIGVGFARRHRMPSLAISCGTAFMAAMQIRAVAANYAAGTLQLVSSHWPPHSGLIPAHIVTSMPLVKPILNHAILLAPWQPALLAPTANLCAWLTIGLATYALARRYAWPETSIAVALLVVCMPRMLQQVLVPQSDLLPAAAAITALLALFRAVEEPHGRDLAMLAAAIGFTVAGGPLCYLLPSVLLLLSFLVLGRRHQLRLWPSALIGHPIALLAALTAVLVFSHIVVGWLNLAHGGPWIGVLPEELVVFNADGLSGAAANLVRYLLQSLHLPEAVDRFFKHGFGISPLLLLQAFYQKTIAAALDGNGAAVPFRLSWARQDPFMWFGPTGFFLSLPAVLYAMRKGPRRLKNTMGALTAYTVLIALILAWQPRQVSMLTPFFACSGFSMAFFLPPWRLSRNGRIVLQLYAIGLAIYTMMP